MRAVASRWVAPSLMLSLLLSSLVGLGCEGTLVLVGPEDPDASRPPPPRGDAGPAPRGDAGALGLVDAGTPIGPIDAGSAPGLTWNAVLITGDDSITAFDNARERLAAMFLEEAVAPGDLIQLSRDASEQVDGVRDTTVEEIERAMVDLEVGEGDACLVHLTSHGSRSGFYIAGRTTLAPDRLDAILDRACGQRPTVALISACYSGVFVEPLRAPNRVILTAAHADRTSFGCSAEAEYTYWDGCLIRHFADARTWGELYQQVTKCIEAKEAGGFTPSMPQLSLGDEVTSLPIFHR